MTVTIAPFLLYKNGTVCGIASHLGEMCEEMIGLCGLSSWDAPTPVQCIVLCSFVLRLAQWLSGICIGLWTERPWFTSRAALCCGAFFAISPLVKLLVQPNGSIVIVIVIVIAGGAGRA